MTRQRLLLLRVLLPAPLQLRRLPRVAAAVPAPPLALALALALVQVPQLCRLRTRACTCASCGERRAPVCVALRRLRVQLLKPRRSSSSPRCRPSGTVERQTSRPHGPAAGVATVRMVRPPPPVASPCGCAAHVWTLRRRMVSLATKTQPLWMRRRRTSRDRRSVGRLCVQARCCWTWRWSSMASRRCQRVTMTPASCCRALTALASICACAYTSPPPRPTPCLLRACGTRVTAQSR